VLVAPPVWAQTKYENWEKCLGHDSDLSIAGCTALIHSGQEAPENLAMAYDHRGDSYGMKDLYDQAIPDYNKAIELKPDYAGAYINRGIAYYFKRFFDQAIADFTKGIGLKPDADYAYTFRGLAYEKLGQRNQAISDYRAALRLNPNSNQSMQGLTRLGVTP
jgi:tetratricopeptide (TPR) repeat protein